MQLGNFCGVVDIQFCEDFDPWRLGSNPPAAGCKVKQNYCVIMYVFGTKKNPVNFCHGYLTMHGTGGASTRVCRRSDIGHDLIGDRSETNCRPNESLSAIIEVTASFLTKQPPPPAETSQIGCRLRCDLSGTAWCPNCHNLCNRLKLVVAERRECKVIPSKRLTGYTI